MLEKGRSYGQLGSTQGLSGMKKNWHGTGLQGKRNQELGLCMPVLMELYKEMSESSVGERHTTLNDGRNPDGNTAGLPW